MIKKIINPVLVIACLSVIPAFLACENDDPQVTYELPEEEYPTEGPVKAEIIYEGEVPRLYRNGKPYYVKGAAYNNFMDLVPEYGGNSIRTYSVDENTQAVLDSALANKLTVCLGIWVNRETDGFDYDNAQEVAEQKERVREEVLRFKDHPAVLMWGIGNEVDAQYTDYKVWNAIGDISDMIHELDTNHLTTTVLAGADPKDIEEIMERAPSLDILGVNSYSAIGNVQKNTASAGWTKPYMITEWGPKGTWENVSKTSWGGIQELSSTEKGEVYKNTYTSHIAANFNRGCVGSYAFLWGYQLHGAVATWYGVFTPKKKPLETAHALYYSWSGSYPSNRAPRIENSGDILLNGRTADESIVVKAGEDNFTHVRAVDLEGDELTYEWQIVREGFVVSDDQEFEGSLPGLEGLFEDNSKRNARFVMQGEGTYRLYAFVYDSEGNVASAVIPFKVEK
ncbi:glycoside hydrolase family 2 TIM barrel-domain containing protein [Sinomicrobium soli]|uniref:glycoside hydrolase family 2 TIM barrel-domain containing protein n=1 Tax=Sinomicrobium sp. N-1-3-6 TaxID=2219864 RepID=UPI0013750B8D|nr:glycoside hydrolase family 2 TIM barrel-domain containing protein [Sinomicrobium sp. N-1-3-6]